MKKIFLVSLLAISLFSACGSKKTETTESTTETTTSTTTETSNNSSAALSGRYFVTVMSSGGGQEIPTETALEFQSDGKIMYSFDGYQSAVRHICTSNKKSDTEMDIIFDSYGEVDMLKNGYNKGDVIGTAKILGGDKIEFLSVGAAQNEKLTLTKEK